MKKYISPDSQQYFAFNVWSMESAKAVIDAAEAVQKNVILQTSMRAFEHLDKEGFCTFIKAYAKKKNIQAFLHLDHCKKMESIQEAILRGWDSVMIDASDQDLEENIRITNEVCELAGKAGVLVEAEVGQICGQEDEVSAMEAGVARIEDIDRFLQNTNVHMLAAAVGTVHGLNRAKLNIHYDLIEKTGSISDIPFVIHGGTGLTENTFLHLLSYKNVKKINLSTEVKLAYRQGVEESIQRGFMKKDGFDPLKMQEMIDKAIKNMAIRKLKLLEGEK